MNQPLSPSDMFPARSSDIAQRFITLPSGVRLRVAESGPMDGAPVVMLPGWGATIYMYRHALDELPRRGLRTIAVDLRGFGLSDRPMTRGAYTLDAYESDLLALLDALELQAPTLIGQSMGGGLALRFAIRHPERVRRLVLINPTGLIRLNFLPLLRTLPRFVASSLGPLLVPRAIVSFILRRLAYGNANLVSERDIDEYWSPTQLPGYVYAGRSALSEFDWRPLTPQEAAALTIPTLVLLGERDRLVRNDDAAANRLASATVSWLSGGHCAHEEDPATAYARIARFVESATTK
jgi:pimeloyl-ACP methyl ester carboxylesterase